MYFWFSINFYLSLFTNHFICIIQPGLWVSRLVILTTFSAIYVWIIWLYIGTIISIVPVPFLCLKWLKLCLHFVLASFYVKLYFALFSCTIELG